MKKSIVFAWAILCTLPALFSSEATTSPPEFPNEIIVKVAPVSKKKAFVLRMANLQQKPLRIMIQDADGNSYYSEKITDHNGYRKLFNLGHLDSGEYEILILHPNESKVGTITVGPKSAQVSWQQEGLAGR